MRKLLSMILGCLLAGTWGSVVMAQTSAPASKPARSQEAIKKELGELKQQLTSFTLHPERLMDPAKRAEVGPKVIPILRKIEADMEELGRIGAEPGQEVLEARRFDVMALAMELGDKEAEQTLKQRALGADANAARAKTAILEAKWILADKKAAEQSKVMDEAEELAKANPSLSEVAELCVFMAHFGPATPELKHRAAGIVTTRLKGAAAEQMKAEIKAKADSAKTQRAMLNKPLVLEGMSLSGTKFSTAQWKGKVILVDFWATWCGPCKAELPRIKKTYAELHEKGLEVLGVSCDHSADDLKSFLKEKPEMPWPQLFDAENPGWHPLTRQFGITGIPTMFVIDRKGVLRSVNAGEDFEQTIPKLLAEKEE
ncbi:MAG: redoxin family protein [Verrucomicrobiota bacterium]|nr:redoxin family protein [Verrucomicrobiota bacterium]